MNNLQGIQNVNELLKAINSNKYKRALEEAEKYIYMKAFRDVRYNQSKAAVVLGVSRGTFRKRLETYLEEK